MCQRYSRSSARYSAANNRSRPVFARRRRFSKKAVLALAVAVLVIVMPEALAWMADGLAALDPASASSTPVSEWRRGSAPYLYQTDSAWAEEPYAGGTVEENGCGPTCLSMVYIDLTGKKDFDPGEMASFSEQEGYVASGMTSWTLMTEGAAKLGLASEELPRR